MFSHQRTLFSRCKTWFSNLSEASDLPPAGLELAGPGNAVALALHLHLALQQLQKGGKNRIRRSLGDVDAAEDHFGCFLHLESD